MRKIQIHNLDLHRKTLDLVMDKAVKVLSSFNAMEQWKLCPQPAGVCVCVCQHTTFTLVMVLHGFDNLYPPSKGVFTSRG